MVKSAKHFIIWSVLAISIVFAGPAIAADAVSWTVRTVSGKAELKGVAGAWTALSEGLEVEVGNSIRTAAKGRVVLVRNDESVIIAANSDFEIKPASNGMLTRIFQTVGTLMFKVHKRPNQHFEVNTPYLAAVVKGTTFTVSVDANGAAVHVTEGLVQVKGNDGPETLLLRPGQTGSIKAEPGSTLKSGSAARDGGSSTKKQTKAPAIKKEIQSAALDIGEVSNGLISSVDGLINEESAVLADTIDGLVAGAGIDGVGGSGIVGGLGDTGGGLAGGLGGAISGLSGGVGGAVSGLSGGLGGAVSGLSGGLGGAVGGGLGGAVSGVGGAAGGAVAGAGGAAGGAVGGLGGGLGDILGGL